uniref:Uncharacterized protein n=1 Tax=Parastrongyloides trichosuri TaxID=131310 RepID=A0A0N5A5K8_PARTI
MTLRAPSTSQINSQTFSYYHPQSLSTSSNSTTSSSPLSQGICGIKNNNTTLYNSYNPNIGNLIYTTKPNYYSNKNDYEKIVEVNNLSTPPGMFLNI